MENVVIFVPTEREAAHFAEQGLSALICGVGMAECAATIARVISNESSAGRRPRLAVLAGVAGVYGDALSVGDTVVVETETVADLGRREADGGFTPMFQKTYPATFMPEVLPTGIVAASGVTVNMAGALGTACPATPPDRAAVHESVPLLSEDVPERIVVENMEGAAFFAVCRGLGIPAMEVRAVSNRVGEAVTAPNLDTAARRLAADLRACLDISVETLIKRRICV